jgi:hypothetical protein
MANKFEEIKSKFDKELNDDSKIWTKYLKLAEAKTNVPRLYIAAGKFHTLHSKFMLSI